MVSNLVMLWTLYDCIVRSFSILCLLLYMHCVKILPVGTSAGFLSCLLCLFPVILFFCWRLKYVWYLRHPCMTSFLFINFWNGIIMGKILHLKEYLDDWHIVFHLTSVSGSPCKIYRLWIRWRWVGECERICSWALSRFRAFRVPYLESWWPSAVFPGNLILLGHWCSIVLKQSYPKVALLWFGLFFYG